MDHLIFDGGLANPKKNIEQAHPPGKKILQDAGYLEKNRAHEVKSQKHFSF